MASAPSSATLAGRLVAYHRKAIQQPRRVRIVAAASRLLTEVLPPHPTLLDVGCGDGKIAAAVAKRLGGEARGVDILLRPECRIPVQRYDGTRLPFDDASCDAVMLCDVLHHDADPERLLRECLRVARHAVVVKDHFAFGPLSDRLLWLMDVSGNTADGVAMNGRYLQPAAWVELLRRAGGHLHTLHWPLRIHDLPWRLVTRSELQFIALVEPASTGPCNGDAHA